MSEGKFSGLSGLLAGSAAAITAVGGLVAILVQVGVIGGEDNTSTNANPNVPPSTVISQPGTADWASQANDICAKANDDNDALPDPETIGADPAQLASAGREAVDIGQRQLRELSKLTPPQNDGPKVKRLLRIYAQSNDAAEEFFAALRVGDVSGLQSHTDALKRLGKASDDLATQLGASTCAEGASFVGTDLGG